MSDLEPLLQNCRTAMVSVMDHTPGQRQFASLDAYYTYYQGKFGYTDAEMEAYMADRKREHELHAAPNRKQVVEQARDRRLAIASHDDATRDHVEEAIADGIVVAEFPTTIEAARAGFMEQEIGSLEAGKQADFIVLDRDIMRVPDGEIPAVRVVQTWVGGKKVYDREAPRQ